MNFIDYFFSLDIHAAYAQTSLTVMKKDSKRRLCINLVEKGRPYEISEECYAVFAAKKPDGKFIYNNCVIENNKIIYEITEQTTIAVGEMPCEIKLYGADDALISSPRFKIIVNKPVFDDEDENEIESSNEVTALTALISQASSLVDEIETKLENGELNGKGLTILGYYETLSELEAAVALPEIGDVYGIGSSAPYNIYVWTINGWVDNGQIQGPEGKTGPQGPEGPQGNPGKDGLTTSVNGVQQVGGNITLTASDIGAQSENRLSTVTLAVNSWTENGSNFSQIISISGIGINDKIDVQPNGNVINQMLNDGVVAIYFGNENGVVTAYSVGAKPTADLTVQVTLSEVR